MKVKLPALYAIDVRRNGNWIRQLLSAVVTIEAAAATYTWRSLTGTMLQLESDPSKEILITGKKGVVPESVSLAIYHEAPVDAAATEADCAQGKWVKHPKRLITANREQCTLAAQQARQSWLGTFRFLKEDPVRDVPGLRNPQIGAVHAVFAHWSVSEEAGTIVMPTGTGKTETMLSVLVARPCDKVLVVVPTDALRTQIFDKFVALGVLKSCGVVADRAAYPVVGMLNRKPKSIEEVDDLFESCNVVVTTGHIAGQCDPDIQKRIASHCSDLFIDEAHHVEARTWKSLKAVFDGRRILQFTATPFREDDRVLEGEIIYRYPLRRAQQEGFFKPIHFKSVVEFDLTKSDRAVAAAAIDTLESDTTGKHILMARAGTTERADEIFKLYRPYSQYKPVQLHTGITSYSARQEARKKIISGESRIVVCVDMLGEGFDLPELKIAAFHDIRKSLAVTLQIAGRFTRARQDLGEPTFVANIGDADVKGELRKLYMQDPDWNLLLPELSEKIIDEQEEVRTFLDGFGGFPADIPLRSLRPATSTVVYKTTCADWSPERFREGIDSVESYARLHHSINAQTHTLVIVSAQKAALEWIEVEDLYTWDWELLVVLWDPDTKLLYIHSSGNRGTYRELARAAGGQDAELIREPEVFRCFAGITRLRLTNVGLTEQIARLISFTGRMGADVEAALSEAHKRNTRKAVLFGSGYENGARTTVGASRKGRIWSFRRERLNTLSEWCRSVGAKLLDNSIDPDEVLKGTLQSETVTVRPALMPIAVDWPEEFYRDLESIVNFFIDGRRWPLFETSVELVNPKEQGDLEFVLRRDSESVSFALKLFEADGAKDYRFEVTSGQTAWIGNRQPRLELVRFFYNSPPVFWFANGATLDGNRFTPLRPREPFDRSKIVVMDWSGIDITKEAQGIEKATDSVQFKVIQSLLVQDQYDVVFDDDGSGEIADVVAIRAVTLPEKRTVHVDLYHCKYSLAPTAGSRIDDLYIVCGQAQKSVSWSYSEHKQVDLFSHLLRREPKQREGKEATRFEKGTKQTLLNLRDMSRASEVKLRIFIVQPGLSKSDVSPQQLQLLGVTENYLKETHQLPFFVIGSA